MCKSAKGCAGVVGAKGSWAKKEHTVRKATGDHKVRQTVRCRPDTTVHKAIVSKVRWVHKVRCGTLCADFKVLLASACTDTRASLVLLARTVHKARLTIRKPLGSMDPQV